MRDSAATIWSRAARPLLIAGRWALAVALGGGALALLLRGRAAFARLGRPDEARIALACGEIAGAILFLFRRTARAGSLALVIVLAWVAGFHFALGQPTERLWLYLASVLALAAATQILAVRQRT